MDGVIYYPYIRLPESAWFSRAVLYWDSVATIVPDQWIADPDKLEPTRASLCSLESSRSYFPHTPIWSGWEFGSLDTSPTLSRMS